MKNYSISFCTVSMNRLHHLQRTMPANILHNKAYENLEFVLLDYNSSDGLEGYIKSTYSDHIRSGRLCYYRVTAPAFFHRTHSRNLAFKMAGGEIICNIDADNFTGEGFAEYINRVFQSGENIFLAALDPGNPAHAKDVLGRICMRKRDFLAIGGYNETMKSYGFEDYFMVNRLKLAGLEHRIINDRQYLGFIAHSDHERIANECLVNECESILIRHIDHAKSELIFLCREGRFSKGTLIDNVALHASEEYVFHPANGLKYEFSIAEDEWNEGHWQKGDKKISLYDNDTIFHLLFDLTLNLYISEDGSLKFHCINDKEMICEAIFFL